MKIKQVLIIWQYKKNNYLCSPKIKGGGIRNDHSTYQRR